MYLKNLETPDTELSFYLLGILDRHSVFKETVIAPHDAWTAYTVLPHPGSPTVALGLDVFGFTHDQLSTFHECLEHWQPH